jgi:hypothetical protein
LVRIGRIGVNLGDVLIAGDDIVGDDVNFRETRISFQRQPLLLINRKMT